MVFSHAAPLDESPRVAVRNWSWGRRKIDADDCLLDAQARELYRYYGLPFEEPIAGRAGAAPQNTDDRVLQYLM